MSNTQVNRINSTLFQKDSCTILPGSSSIWSSSNSEVVSSPVVLPKMLFGIDSNVKVAASIVSITGESGEHLHFHISHLVGIIVKGEGELRIQDRESQVDEKRIKVVKGDAVIIPKGVLHCFECEDQKNMEYIALEVSDLEIDYQKHHT